MPIKISVVIPTYKRPGLLINCLTALCAQDLEKQDFEVIVVSDGPDEETGYALAYWLKKRKINISFLHTPEKKGPAGARNLGWLHARAPLIAFTDDDCIPGKKWLSSFLKQFHEDAFIAFTGKTKVPLDQDPSDFACNTAHLAAAEFITANCACTKNALICAGGFDERFKLAWREDSDLHFKLLLHKIPVVRIPEAVVIHPVRTAEWGVSIREQKKGIYDALLFKKHPDLYRSKVQAKPLLDYYLIVLLWLLLLVFIYMHALPLVILTAFLLILSVGRFFYNRLKNTNKSVPHVIEMLVTSVLIPFLSVYWRLYGAIKFRVFFI